MTSSVCAGVKYENVSISSPVDGFTVANPALFIFAPLQCLGSAHRKSVSHSTGPVVELWEVERPCPLLAAPREDLEFRCKPLVEAIESAFLHENGAREVLEVVGEHPGTTVSTEDAIEPLSRTCFGIRT